MQVPAECLASARQRLAADLRVIFTYFVIGRRNLLTNWKFTCKVMRREQKQIHLTDKRSLSSNIDENISESINKMIRQ